MGVFKIIGSKILRLQHNGLWLPINYSDVETLIRKIREYQFEEQNRVVVKHEQDLKKFRCNKP